MSQGWRPQKFLGLLVVSLVLLVPVGTYYTLRKVRRQQFSLLENEIGWAVGTMQSKVTLAISDSPPQNLDVSKVAGGSGDDHFSKWTLSAKDLKESTADWDSRYLVAEIFLFQHGDSIWSRPQVRVKWSTEVNSPIRDALDAAFKERGVEYETNVP